MDALSWMIGRGVEINEATRPMSPTPSLIPEWLRAQYRFLINRTTSASLIPSAGRAVSAFQKARSGVVVVAPHVHGFPALRSCGPSVKHDQTRTGSANVICVKERIREVVRAARSWARMTLDVEAVLRRRRRPAWPDTYLSTP